MAMEQYEKDKSCSIMQLQFSNQSEQVASFFFSKGSNTPSILAPYQSSDLIAANKDSAIYAHTSAGAWVIESNKEEDLLTLYKLEATNKEVIKQVPASQVKDILFIVNPQGQAGMFLRAAKEPEVSSDTNTDSEKKAEENIENNPISVPVLNQPQAYIHAWVKQNYDNGVGVQFSQNPTESFMRNFSQFIQDRLSHYGYLKGRIQVRRSDYFSVNVQKCVTRNLFKLILDQANQHFTNNDNLK